MVLLVNSKGAAMTAQNELEVSYLIAEKLFGYLWANGAIKKTNLGMTEEQFEQHIVAELARQVREIFHESSKESYLKEYDSNYGLEPIAAAVQWDIEGRGQSWPYFHEAGNLLARIQATMQSRTWFNQ